MAQQRYRVIVDDNFHYMQEDERYEAGTFGSYAEALAKCKEIVEASLRQMAKPEMTADELYSSYVTFGDDPWIPETPEAVGESRRESREWLRGSQVRVGPAVIARC